MRRHIYFVYILTSQLNKVLYIGVTNDLARRIKQHKSHEFGGFAARYNVHKLVYYEVFQYIEDAILREKRLKGGPRLQKMDLIAAVNPHWIEMDAELEVAQWA